MRHTKRTSARMVEAIGEMLSDRLLRRQIKPFLRVVTSPSMAPRKEKKHVDQMTDAERLDAFEAAWKAHRTNGLRVTQKDLDLVATIYKLEGFKIGEEDQLAALYKLWKAHKGAGFAISQAEAENLARKLGVSAPWPTLDSYTPAKTAG